MRIYWLQSIQLLTWNIFAIDWANSKWKAEPIPHCKYHFSNNNIIMNWQSYKWCLRKMAHKQCPHERAATKWPNMYCSNQINKTLILFSQNYEFYILHINNWVREEISIIIIKLNIHISFICVYSQWQYIITTNLFSVKWIFQINSMVYVLFAPSTHEHKHYGIFVTTYDINYWIDKLHDITPFITQIMFE